MRENKNVDSFFAGFRAGALVSGVIAAVMLLMLWIFL